MITRPLDIAAKLRPEPRNFDFLFFVNGGLLVLQLGVAFANVAPSALYQQQADAIATKLSQRLAALS